MIVEFRNGEMSIVMLNPDCEDRELIGIDRGKYISLDEYEEDLALKGIATREWDIMKIYSMGSSICHILSDKEKALSKKLPIWVRTESPTEMTISEIEAKLGIKNLKIIKEN
jgi:hypothetical protein